MDLPRVVIAAPASGHGKTTIATGLMAALRRNGSVVSGHKVGPDYIDAGYHALATGRPGRNLDPYLQGEQRVVPLFLHGAATPEPADIAVVEGVMGLFDGAVGGEGFASTAHVAALIGAPVVLVVDAAATGRSVAALVHGFATFDSSVRLGGVVLNKVGSDRHEAEARSALQQTGVPVLGVVRRDAAVSVPSRHLGLIPAAERDVAAVAVVDQLANLVQQSVDVEAVMALARTAGPMRGEPWNPAAEVGTATSGRPVVAVFGGAAFTFAYAEATEMLSAAGCEVVVVDPLVDQSLPVGCAGLVIGGGFPEVHAPALSANESLRRAVTEYVRAGGAVVAECAGLLYLGRELDGHPMCGVLDCVGAMSPRLSLGYRTAVATNDSVLASAGQRVTGHEFHRTVVTPRAGQESADAGQVPASSAWGWTVDGVPQPVEGFAQARMHASYLHLHWAGHPHVVRRFVSALGQR